MKAAVAAALVLAVFVGVFVLMVMWAIGVNNQIVRLDQGVQEKSSQVQNVYQRRSDLIGNLVETVKGYAGHERQTLEAVTQARASATQVKLTPETVGAFQQAQGAMSSALSRLLVSVEKYPDLKANSNFMELQRQLTATENRILVERQRFNAAVRAYNTRITLFPGNVLAGFLGYKSKTYFEADEGAKVVPKVKF